MVANSVKKLVKGEVVYTLGESANCIYEVISGEIGLYQAEPPLEFDSIVSTGEFFGETSLFDDMLRQENAIAMSDSEVRLLPINELQKKLESSDSDIKKLIYSLSDHARKSIKPLPAFDGASSSDEVIKQLMVLFRGNDGLQQLLNDESINDILINSKDKTFVERKGKLEETDVKFSSDSEIFNLAEKIVKAAGRTLDRRRPLVDARLPDGSRVNVIAHPLCVDGTSISIRKFSKKPYTLEIMQEQQNISAQIAEFLKVVTRSKLNTLISGGTGSGKTTLLNAISQHIDDSERIVTIEDAAELRLLQPNLVRLETKPFAFGGNRDEEVSMRDLVKNALRMRPDRIIVGEVRGSEAFDMMQAMNTGHEGSLSTIHANHPRDALSRLENMVSMANLDIPVKSIRYQIASALNLIIQVSRMRDGVRRITYISEIVGMEGDVIVMQDLYNFKAEGEDKDGRIIGSFRWTGIMPRFLRRANYYGELAGLERAFGVKIPKI